MIKRALLSVSDKTGIVDFARSLHELGIEIISTGGTASTIAAAGIPVLKVSDITGFPEIMDGRVKTLHPKIHGALLAVTDNAEHVQAMDDHDITKIDLVAINLYPFESTVARRGATHEEIIENIDIGGPAMVRASAKNYKFTTIIVNPSHYASIIEMLKQGGMVDASMRELLAMEAYSHTARYDALISQYFAARNSITFPHETALPLITDQSLRYGENPHQKAVLYGSFSKIFTQLHGKELSYNNIMDIDAATRVVMEFAEPTCVIVKHNNPCGVGSGSDLVDAYRKAFATDTVSPFGGIIAMNRPVDATMAQEIHSLFAEVLIAPSYSDEALAILQKKKDRRLMTVDYEQLAALSGVDIRAVAGGFLLQTPDDQLLDEQALRVVTERQPTEEERAAMMYAWRIAKHVKSNAIVYASADRSLAIGAGQMSRVDSARIAVRKAQDAGIDLSGCAVASDAFFPFADGLLQAAEAGAVCVIQPGGSVRDEEVIAAANEQGLTMMFTGMRHFRH
ncbi:MAG: bifunctional phosphoribosylaminoimidazolecarboxamide formyltransferase/IMP cyclohydrolase [Bacteroidetes bacterium]|nr:bifunctional phosphoribosylaminoimidazolecarboxamide formyltransferase/IMP cyclohydrolase [Bacteroidota bacterium]